MRKITMNVMYLRWLSLWQRINAKGCPDYAFARLYSHYAECFRKYHNCGHILYCNERLDEVRSILQELDKKYNRLVSSEDTIRLALYYHDLFYDPKRNDNEERSALFMQEEMYSARVSSLLIEEARQCILYTDHTRVPTNPVVWYMLDIDLSSLAKPWEEFITDSRNIREEYREAVPRDEDFNRGRTVVLKRFHERKRLFLTDYFYEKYESRAKVNLARALHG